MQNMAGSMDRLLWGWESFFDEISSFVRDADRQFGTANEGFSQYVVKQTQTCIANLSSLRDHLRNFLDVWNNSIQQDQNEIAVTQRYETSLTELLGLLRRIGQVYIDH